MSCLYFYVGIKLAIRNWYGGKLDNSDDKLKPTDTPAAKKAYQKPTVSVVELDEELTVDAAMVTGCY